MSHIATIQTQITDLEAVKRACKELGLVFKENQTTCAFWPSGNQPQLHPCTHAVELPVGDFRMELGLVKTGNTYSLVGDDLLHMSEKDGQVGVNWCKDIFGRETNPLGQKFGKFLQLYGVHKATMEAQRKGYLVTRKVGANNSIQIVATGM
ncbi:MAG: hypothetical protein JWM68_3742 [Verrucomicrobiales bacterium]|nr:hypothetical protein [Verrucomicrobiales bacterium]